MQVAIIVASLCSSFRVRTSKQRENHGICRPKIEVVSIEKQVLTCVNHTIHGIIMEQMMVINL